MFPGNRSPSKQRRADKMILEEPREPDFGFACAQWICRDSGRGGYSVGLEVKSRCSSEKPELGISRKFKEGHSRSIRPNPHLSCGT